MAETLYALPCSIDAGTTVSYTRTFLDYPATSWTLTLYLNGAAVATSKAAVPSGNSFVVTLSATDTAALAAGTYRYVERVTKAGEAYDVARGEVRVLPNLTGAAAGALLSHAEKTLAIINLAIEGRLTADLESYSVGGRTVNKIPTAELEKLRGKYEAIVYREHNPGKLSRTVYFHFGGWR